MTKFSIFQFSQVSSFLPDQQPKTGNRSIWHMQNYRLVELKYAHLLITYKPRIFHSYMLWNHILEACKILDQAKMIINKSLEKIFFIFFNPSIHAYMPNPMTQELRFIYN